MKLKIDENIGSRGVDLLRMAGHDVMTVRDQGLGGSTDERLFEICSAERRALITLDRDFGQVPRFPPKKSAGIIVLEVGGPASLSLLLARLRDVVALLSRRSVIGELWIIEAGRARLHLDRDQE